MKTCNTCGEHKPLDSFYRNKRMRDGRLNKCKACKVEEDAKYRAETHEYRIDQQAKYREENRDRINERSRAYHHANRDRILEYQSEYRQRGQNREISIERSRQYYWENRDRVLAEHREYQIEKRDEIRARRERNRHWGWQTGYRHRARSYGLEPVVEEFTEEDLIAKYGDACVDCGGKWDQLDHVIPVRLGGAHTLDNCQPICQLCNLRRWQKFRKEAFALLVESYIGIAA